MTKVQRIATLKTEIANCKLQLALLRTRGDVIEIVKAEISLRALEAKLRIIRRK
jgi:hypothetical protein